MTCSFSPFFFKFTKPEKIPSGFVELGNFVTRAVFKGAGTLEGQGEAGLLKGTCYNVRTYGYKKDRGTAAPPPFRHPWQFSKRSIGYEVIFEIAWYSC